jgi:hypothetical protein
MSMADRNDTRLKLMCIKEDEAMQLALVMLTLILEYSEYDSVASINPY